LDGKKKHTFKVAAGKLHVVGQGAKTLSCQKLQHYSGGVDCCPNSARAGKTMAGQVNSIELAGGRPGGNSKSSLLKRIDNFLNHNWANAETES